MSCYHTKSSRSFLLTIAMIITIAHLSTTSMAFEYTVGDSSSGWTNIGTDYRSWSASHEFYVGDVLIFNYNPQAHNVIQAASVTEFEACFSTSPISVHSSGNDRIELDRPGSYFFYCGYGNMCQQGQKVEVSVRDGRSSLGFAPPNLPDLTMVYSDASSSTTSCDRIVNWILFWVITAVWIYIVECLVENIDLFDDWFRTLGGLLTNLRVI